MGGQTIIIPADDLRRVLTGKADHYGRKIWGPFNIDLQRRTVNGHRVQMQVVA
jgi:hypothetical protein